MSRVPIHLIVGSNKPDTFGQYYITTAQVMLDKCRNVAETNEVIYTSVVEVIRGYLLLHKMAEIELTISHEALGFTTYIDVDVKGEFIQPWPDGLFEVGFYLLFSRGLT